VADLEAVFKRYNYSIPNLHQGVPPLIVQSLPTDFAKHTTPRSKKTSFFKTLLPMVLLANERIRQERQVLLQILAQLETQQSIDGRQQHLLRTLKQRYKVKGDLLDEETLNVLKRRVDEIPASLVLAQAANESAWGTSRFVREGNNLFGEWTFLPGSGMVPLDRPDGEIYEVRRFNNLYDSILSYLRNLNTHPAYQSLRELREEARLQGRNPSGIELAEGLVNYSTRRELYVTDLQKIIRTNNLQRFTVASLRQG
jgi:Bax protein